MPQSRLTGLLLLLAGILTFLGTTNQMLPAEAFFPALVVCLLGTVVFLKANHSALEEPQPRPRERRQAGVGKETATALADRQAKIDGTALAALDAREGRLAAQAATTEQVQQDELVLYEVDQRAASGAEPEDPKMVGGQDEGDFVVTTDVSFPVEIQAQTSLADQLAKLRRLADDGIISEAEFAIAKAKLLS